MATIVRETIINNAHYYLVLAGRQPIGVYADNGDKIWDPRVDRYMGPAIRDSEFKGKSEASLILGSTFVKQAITPRDAAQHTLNALKAEIKIAAEDGDIVWLGRGKTRYPAARFAELLKTAQKHFQKIVKSHPLLKFSFTHDEEIDACRTAIAALKGKKANPYIIAAVQERLEALDVNERMKRETKPIVR